jgi:phosphoribosylanthranilate isomerase
MNSDLKIKVCGMLYPENRQEVEKLHVDFLGFIFYPGSKRYAGGQKDRALFSSKREKVAVFVDEGIDQIINIAHSIGFKYIQLHGNENSLLCGELKKQGLKIIKAFNIGDNFDFELLNSYDDVVDYYLFDTKSSMPGGSGQKFNWDVLDKYRGDIPFFLSGGIQPEDVCKIKQINHPKFYGVDLNSGFEDVPGLKNPAKLKSFLCELQDCH